MISLVYIGNRIVQSKKIKILAIGGAVPNFLNFVIVAFAIYDAAASCVRLPAARWAPPAAHLRCRA